MTSNMPHPVDKSADFLSWRTPPRILDRVSHYANSTGLPGISLDPCTSPDNPTKAAHFFTEETNGLTTDWGPALLDSYRRIYRLVFINPPYGPQLRPWLARICEQARAGYSIIALLPGQRFEQAYFQDNIFIPELSAICFILRRLRFLDASGTPRSGNPYGSMLYGFNVTRRLFDLSFCDLGRIIPTYF